MALSWGEWKSITERSAAVEYGKRHSKTITFLRFAPYYAAALAAGGIGFVLYRIWTWADRQFAERQAVSADVDTSGIPGMVWAGAAVLLIVTMLVVRGRTGRVRSFGTVVLQGLGLVVAWLGLIAFAVGAAT